MFDATPSPRLILEGENRGTLTRRRWLPFWGVTGNGMIERNFYPLPILAERWTCTVHDLLHLGIQDRAQVCANIYGMASGMRRTRIDTDPPEEAPDDMPLTEKEQREAKAQDAAFERWKNRTTKDMPHGVFELGHDDLRFLDMPSAFPYELHEALKFDGGWWACEFDPPVSINLDHLCMLHEEVQRLDCEVFAVRTQVTETLVVSAPISNKPLSTRERNTMLRLIGGLAMAGWKIHIHERLNGIAEMVNDLAAVGVSVSEDTLRERLREAAQVIEPTNRK